MRTQAQMLSRKRATRVVSLVLIVVGAVTLVTTTLSANDLPRSTLFDHLEVAALWFVAAGAFVGLSRIWGELAERTGPGSEKF
jgi:energy-converting hydrogenase Eha subunit G